MIEIDDTAPGLTSIAVIPPVPPNLLESLEGLALSRGWVVGGRILPGVDQTGGRFSVGYECRSTDGQIAFMKAIDLSEALGEPDLIRALNMLTDAVQCEIELLQETKRMSRVVTALDFDNLREIRGVRLQVPIPYIIFERATGNARSVVKASAKPKHSWCMAMLHNVATGLQQLHKRDIAHLDLKPSNVLLFEGDAGAKVSDLGRSIRKGRAVWYDAVSWPGDSNYAPPEIVYGFHSAEFNVRRLAADLFLLGNFASVLICSVPMNTLIYDQIPKDLRPALLGGNYSGTFENALPHLRAAFVNALDRVAQEIPLDAPYRDAFLRMITHWCEPDPLLRGHPETRARYAAGGNIYELERYVSALPNLMMHARAFEGRRNAT